MLHHAAGSALGGGFRRAAAEDHTRSRQIDQPQQRRVTDIFPGHHHHVQIDGTVETEGEKLRNQRDGEVEIIVEQEAQLRDRNDGRRAFHHLRDEKADKAR